MNRSKSFHFNNLSDLSATEVIAAKSSLKVLLKFKMLFYTFAFVKAKKSLFEGSRK
jgi:hypothetical protein